MSIHVPVRLLHGTSNSKKPKYYLGKLTVDFRDSEKVPIITIRCRGLGHQMGRPNNLECK